VHCCSGAKGDPSTDWFGVDQCRDELKRRSHRLNVDRRVVFHDVLANSRMPPAALRSLCPSILILGRGPEFDTCANPGPETEKHTEGKNEAETS
jgi:hypothetical protein